MSADDADPFADLPLLSSLSLKAPATPTVQPVRLDSSGKQPGGVSPSAFGIVDRSEPRVGVFLVSVSDLGNRICGAKVGAKGCICVAATDDCSFSTHRSAKSKVDPSVFGDSDSILLIQVPGKSKQNVAYLQPSLSTSGLSDSILGNYRRQFRTVTEWQTVFQSVEHSVRAGAPASVMAKRSMAVGFSTDAITPRVKRHRYSDETSEQDSESANSPFEAVDPEELPVQLPGRDDAENFAAVISLWPSLVKALGNLQQGLSSLDSGLSSFKITVSDDVDELEDKIATDRTLIGRRPEEAGTSSLWEAIGELKEMVSNFETNLASSGDSKPPDIGDRTKELQDLLQKVQTKWELDVQKLEANHRLLSTQSRNHINLNDARELFNRRANAMMEGALGKALRDMGTRLTALEAGGRPVNAPFRPVETGMTRDEAELYFEERMEDMEREIQARLDRHGPSARTGLLSAGETHASDLLDLRAEVDKLVKGQAEIREEMASESVKIAGRVFNSLTDVKKWIQKNGVIDAIYLFVDAFSFVQLSTKETTSTEESVDFEHRTKKSGYRSEDEAIFVKSYDLYLPEILGKVDGATVSKKVLPKVPDFASWDRECDGEGVGVHITEACTAEYDALKNLIDNDVFAGPGGAEGRAVASAMLDACKTWTSSWVVFVNSYYHDLDNASDASKEECWTHTAQVIRTIWKDIAMVRRSAAKGLGPTNANLDRAGRFLWGALQAHRIMNQYTTAGFKDHPGISPILTRHLFANRASSIQLQALKGRIDATETLAKATKKAADTATTLANKALKKHGNQG